MEGISVRSIFLQIFTQIVIVLYLLDNQTSKIIWVPELLTIFFNIWKLKSIFKFERIPKFPFFRLADRKNYSDSDTNKYDQEATRRISYVLYPLLIFYAIYTYFQQTDDISYYSFTLRTLVGAIYVFEFI